MHWCNTRPQPLRTIHRLRDLPIDGGNLSIFLRTAGKFARTGVFIPHSLSELANYASQSKRDAYEGQRGSRYGSTLRNASRTLRLKFSGGFSRYAETYEAHTVRRTLLTFLSVDACKFGMMMVNMHY